MSNGVLKSRFFILILQFDLLIVLTVRPWNILFHQISLMKGSASSVQITYSSSDQQLIGERFMHLYRVTTPRVFMTCSSNPALQLGLVNRKQSRVHILLIAVYAFDYGRTCLWTSHAWAEPIVFMPLLFYSSQVDPDPTTSLLNISSYKVQHSPVCKVFMRPWRKYYILKKQVTHGVFIESCLREKKQ